MLLKSSEKIIDELRAELAASNIAFDAKVAECDYLYTVIDELRTARNRLARELQLVRRLPDTPPMAAMETAYGDVPGLDPTVERHAKFVTIDNRE